MSILRNVAVLAFVAFAYGCASDVARTSAVLASQPAGDAQRITVVEDATVRSSSGYSRTLPAGSTWELRGTLPQGRVYRRVGDVFTVEGAHVHEAYLVVSGDLLVGYYLPVEQAYSQADPVTLKIK